MIDNHLRWYGHVLKRSIKAVLRRVKMINISAVMRGRGRLRTLVEIIKRDLYTLNLTKYMIFYGSQW